MILEKVFSWGYCYNGLATSCLFELWFMGVWEIDD